MACDGRNLIFWPKSDRVIVKQKFYCINSNNWSYNEYVCMTDTERSGTEPLLRSHSLKKMWR